MNFKKTKAFTLVELIVVITILAILGTIAFISFQGYSKTSRDSVRINDMSTIKTGLELFHIEAGKYPLSTNSFSVTYSGFTEVWTQGTLGEDTIGNIDKLDKMPLDPLTEKQYTYSLTPNRQEYQLATLQETGDYTLIQSKIEANALEEESIALVTGNYNGVAIKTLNNTNCNVLALPSIISAEDETETSLENLVANDLLVYTGYNNLPGIYKGSNYKNNGGFGYSNTANLLAYSDADTCKSLYSTTDSTNRDLMFSNLQNAYSGGLVKVDVLENGNAELVVNNVLGGKLEVAKSSSNTQTSYNIGQSLRFNDYDSAYLSRTPSLEGNRKTFTWSSWIKRTSISNANTLILFSANNGNTKQTSVAIESSNKLALRARDSSGNGALLTTMTFSDPGAWYNIVYAVDTTKSTASDRMKVYVNGKEVVNFDTIVYPAQNAELDINNTVEHFFGASYYNSSYSYNRGDYYLGNTYLIDGQALTPDNFGEFDSTYGHWKPKAYTGEYGTNGFALDYSDLANIGADKSGNGNDFVANNLDATDIVLDSPTNNFATFNPLASNGILSEGNLKVTTTADGNRGGVATIAVNSGKWYYEDYVISNSAKIMIGLASSKTSLYNIENRIMYWGMTGDIYNEGLKDSYSNHIITAGDIIGVAFDIDNNTIEFYINGISQGVYNYNYTAGSYVPFIGHGDINSDVEILNFGQDSSFAGNKTRQGFKDSNGIGDFYYQPPAGYLALSTANLPEPTVVPSENFEVITYEGNDISQTINTNVNTDLVWVKSRTAAEYNIIHDIIRGDYYGLSSNALTGDDYHAGSLSNLGGKSFDIGNYDAVNNINNDFVSWIWKAGGSPVTNTDGTITSQVSANPEAGFSIIGYSGNSTIDATVGHGLLKKPELIIRKSRNGSLDNWIVQLSDWNTVSGEYMYLNTTAGKATYSDFSTDYDSDNMILKSTNFNYNGSGLNYIAYAFHSVPGYSKIGTYIGNGSADGTFVYTGFKPKYIMVKGSSYNSNWNIYDTVRKEWNVSGTALRTNLSDAEFSSIGGTYDLDIDIVSNGFKFRQGGSSHDTNQTNATYIYYAIAEQPFKYANAR